MFSSMKNSVAAYEQVGLDMVVETADPHRLIQMLFEGASAALATAKYAMENGNTASKGAAISKAIDIISNGLDASLDTEQGGELAERLSSLYQYMASRLLWANLKNDVAALTEVQGLISELQDAWNQIKPNVPG
ncbi:flagellar export chaperone FliS [Azoarcus taiwanensis]|uniref:Flagellar secretion chaperone FliS n=1 Tax=Azoarcus taiwanensis TaxID=666964 RepID=A0A972FL32_9RHOO|nr:flagellar export chaperone FliS [Azoarcus taiwanensis]NMG04261.1 flagellar export chaperone FliS [Azoarcus taiwanensis]